MIVPTPARNRCQRDQETRGKPYILNIEKKSFVTMSLEGFHLGAIVQLGIESVNGAQ